MCVIVMGVQLAVFILLSFRFLKKGEEEYEYEIEDISDKDFPFKKYIPNTIHKTYLSFFLLIIFHYKNLLTFYFTVALCNITKILYHNKFYL